MANTWLETAMEQSVSRGQTSSRTIHASGTNTTVRDVPSITRTTTETAVAVDTVTNEDEGVIISFSVPIQSVGFGTVPVGAEPPVSPICPVSDVALTDGTGASLTDQNDNNLTDQ